MSYGRPPMEYRTLGSTGTVVSAQCLGTMTFGARADEETAHDQLDPFVERGGQLHRHGRRLQRGALRGDHRALAGGPARHARPARHRHQGSLPDGRRTQRRRPVRAPPARALDASLRRLGVDHIDLYQMHAWDPLTPIEETLRLLRRRGARRQDPLLRLLQLPRLAAAQGGAARAAARLAPIVTLQPQYNLLVRDIELEIVAVCRNEGIGLLPWSPLAGGWLTGKYVRDQMPTGATRLGENPERGMEAYGPRNAAGAHLAGHRRRAARSPTAAACRCRRSRWPGWPTGRRSPR